MVNLTMTQLKNSFPFETPRARQMEELKELAKQPNGHLFEMPPGEGKTGILLTPLIAKAKKKQGPLFFVTPTKTQVEQIAKTHPEHTLIMYGRAQGLAPTSFYGLFFLQGWFFWERPFLLLSFF